MRKYSSSHHDSSRSSHLSASIQPRPWSSPLFEHNQPVKADFSHVDLFSHAPQRSPIQVTFGANASSPRREITRPNSILIQRVLKPEPFENLKELYQAIATYNEDRTRKKLNTVEEIIANLSLENQKNFENALSNLQKDIQAEKGFLYLKDRREKMPKGVNSATIPDEALTNCAITSVAALLGITSEDMGTEIPGDSKFFQNYAEQCKRGENNGIFNNLIKEVEEKEKQTSIFPYEQLHGMLLYLESNSQKYGLKFSNVDFSILMKAEEAAQLMGQKPVGTQFLVYSLSSQQSTVNKQATSENEPKSNQIESSQNSQFLPGEAHWLYAEKGENGLQYYDYQRDFANSKIIERAFTKGGGASTPRKENFLDSSNTSPFHPSLLAKLNIIASEQKEQEEKFAPDNEEEKNDIEKTKFKNSSPHSDSENEEEISSKFSKEKETEPKSFGFSEDLFGRLEKVKASSSSPESKNEEQVFPEFSEKESLIVPKKSASQKKESASQKVDFSSIFGKLEVLASKQSKEKEKSSPSKSKNEEEMFSEFSGKESFNFFPGKSYKGSPSDSASDEESEKFSLLPREVNEPPGPDIAQQPFAVKYEKNSLDFEKLAPSFVLFVSFTPDLSNN